MLTKTVNQLLQFVLTVNVCVKVRLLTFIQCQDRSVASDWPSLYEQCQYSVKPSIQLLCNTSSYLYTEKEANMLRSALICLLFNTSDLSGITHFYSLLSTI